MTMTDPIADYLTRIRNASKARHRKVDVPASKMKEAITQILLNHKFIENYIRIEDGKQGILRIYLKYSPDEKPVIHGLRRISKPGRRVYVDSDNIPRVMNNLGIAILSTSRGLMSNKQAMRERVGGEVLCYVW
ncbi:MAG TPA: 30S ribosomal protein S8 [Bacteroidetes bacterium]|nr:30S ribosomal protein S8 [Bacteroidota bacterium]